MRSSTGFLLRRVLRGGGRARGLLLHHAGGSALPPGRSRRAPALPPFLRPGAPPRWPRRAQESTRDVPAPPGSSAKSESPPCRARRARIRPIDLLRVPWTSPRSGVTGPVSALPRDLEATHLDGRGLTPNPPELYPLEPGPSSRSEVGVRRHTGTCSERGRDSELPESTLCLSPFQTTLKRVWLQTPSLKTEGGETPTERVL